MKAFPKIFAIGTDYIKDIFSEEVEITEKVDGSQFGFGKQDGEIITRSKGKVQYQGAVDQMFQTAVDYVHSIADRIPDNTFFYAEYLQSPHHNSLTYKRVPKNNLILFGVCDATDKFVSSYDELKVWADKLDIEVVPLLFKGKVTDLEMFKQLIDVESVLGGAKVEGVVVKNYERQFLLGGQPMPLMAGKYVSEAFKEVHRGWGKEHTNKGGWELFKMGYRTEPRWDKAIQHLRESGELTNTPKDIPLVMKEVQRDIEEEEGETIRMWLWKHQGNELLRLAVSGLPEYYKNKLLERGFEQE